MDRFHRLENEKAFTSGAKSVSVLFVAGLVALLVGHTVMAPHDDAVASAPIAAPATPAAGPDAGTGYFPSAVRSVTGTGDATRDEPPVPTF
jgi:hypothetical protein